MSRERTILFAGGGTGGHIFPSLAVVEQIREHSRSYMPKVHFACSSRPLDAQLLEAAGHDFTPLPVTGMPRSKAGLPGFAWRLVQSVGRCRKLIKQLHVKTVVAMGGYVCGPVVLAARRMDVQCVLVNLDAVAGKANRKLAARCHRVLSVYDLPGLARNVQVVGFPLRQAALATQSPQDARRQLGLQPNGRTLLVTGASQGAQSINEAIVVLAQRGVLDHWQVLHLAGAGNDGPVAQAYATAGVRAVVVPFLEQMGLAWAAADLAISRCGAGSTAEVLANAVPTLFLPYPHHADEHQRLNALPLEQAGGAVILHDAIDPDPNARQIAMLLADFDANPGRLNDMRLRLTAVQRANGAVELARMLLEGI